MATHKQIKLFRHFNRFYTEYLGLFGQSFYDHPINFTEARILYELDARPGIMAKELMQRLRLDKGHLSRLLKRFRKEGWLHEEPSESDGRVKMLSLTTAGKGVMDLLHTKAIAQAGAALDGLSPEERAELLDAMSVIEQILDK